MKSYILPLILISSFSCQNIHETRKKIKDSTLSNKDTIKNSENHQGKAENINAKQNKADREVSQVDEDAEKIDSSLDAVIAESLEGMSEKDVAKVEGALKNLSKEEIAKLEEALAKTNDKEVMNVDNSQKIIDKIIQEKKEIPSSARADDPFPPVVDDKTLPSEGEGVVTPVEVKPEVPPPQKPLDSLDDLVGDNKIEEIASASDGLIFTEGPVWVPAGFLLFSDIPANKIYKWKAKEGLSAYRSPSHNSNGLTVDNNGNLIACEHSGRRVTRSAVDGTEVTVVADHYEGKKFNSPNDCVVRRSTGDIYFTDPPYGLKGATSELGYNGLFKVDPKGKVTRLAVDMNFERPNGLAFNRAESALYVADTQEGKIWTFDILEDGTLGPGMSFADANNPDGIKVDQRDMVYVAAATGVEVFRADGMPLGPITFTFKPANIAFGGPQFDTLYVTARKSVYRIKLNTKGIR